MAGRALANGLKSFVGALLVTIVFPILWMRSLRLARRHADEDPRATAKVGGAILASVLILAGGIFLVLDFQRDAVAGMYGSTDQRISVAVGESEYQENLGTIDTTSGAIPKIEQNLANATRDGNEARAAELREALNDTRLELADAQERVQALAPNHALYGRLQPAVARQDDDAIRSMVRSDQSTDPADMDADVEAALDYKDASVADMRLMMWLFVWPSLAGAFFAPLAFALGSVLKAAFVPSDTVGFRPYPGAAAGWFLLFGAFGLPALPFAAWVFHDVEKRSLEGQIAL